MIPHGVEIFVGLDPIDLRWSFDHLVGIVAERIGRNADSGALFVFFGKRRTAIKVFFCDKTGYCIIYKRLHKNLFRLPDLGDAQSKTVVIDERALDDLLDGIDVETSHRKASSRKPKTGQTFLRLV